MHCFSPNFCILKTSQLFFFFNSTLRKWYNTVITLAVVLVLTLCSQVSRQYFMLLDGIYFIYIYPNILFSKTGSFISNFLFLEILGLQHWPSPHNVVCLPVRQDHYAQTTSAGCCDKRSGADFIRSKPTSPATPETSDEFWTLLSWITAVCVSHGTFGSHKQAFKIHSPVLRRHPCWGWAGRGCRAGLRRAKRSRVFLAAG